MDRVEMYRILMHIASQPRNGHLSIRTNKALDFLAKRVQKEYGLYGAGSAYVLGLVCLALNIPPERAGEVVKMLALDKKKMRR